MFKRIGLAFCVALAFSTLPSLAHAGVDQTFVHQCLDEGGGNGYCYGSPLGFFRSGDANDYSQFVSNGPGNLSFYAQVNGVNFACTFPNNSTTKAMQWAIINHRSYFYLEWKAGKCNYIALSNYSAVP